MLGPIVVRHVTLQLEDLCRSNRPLPNLASSTQFSNPDGSSTMDVHYPKRTCSSAALCACPCSTLKPSRPVTDNDLVNHSNIIAPVDITTNEATNSPFVIPQRPRSLQLPVKNHPSNFNLGSSLSSRPLSETHENLPKRPSLRDVAYQAVRLRKILPSTKPSDEIDDTGLSRPRSHQFARKISISAPVFQCSHNNPTENSSATTIPCNQYGALLSSELTVRPIVHDKRQSSRHLSPFTPSRSRIPKPRQHLKSPTAPSNSDIIDLDAIADAHVSPEVPAHNVSQLSRGHRSGVYIITDDKVPLKPVDANKPASPRTPYKRSMQTWRAQSGLPESSRLPRAGADAILESGSARTLKYQRRCQRPESSSSGVASSKLHRKSHAVFPAVPTSSSKLLLLRRQRERRRSSLR